MKENLILSRHFEGGLVTTSTSNDPVVIGTATMGRLTIQKRIGVQVRHTRIYHVAVMASRSLHGGPNIQCLVRSRVDQFKELLG